MTCWARGGGGGGGVDRINPLQCFYGIRGHVALDINTGPIYDTVGAYSYD